MNEIIHDNSFDNFLSISSVEATSNLNNWLCHRVQNGAELFNELGSFEDFTNWFTEKAGVKQKKEKKQSAIYKIGLYA